VAKLSERVKAVTFDVYMAAPGALDKKQDKHIGRFPTFGKAVVALLKAPEPDGHVLATFQMHEGEDQWQITGVKDDGAFICLPAWEPEAQETFREWVRYVK
jgi:hypothetical protein